MEHCEPKYTGTPIIHHPVGFITNPRTEPHTTIPRGCMYHSGRNYLSMPKINGALWTEIHRDTNHSSPCRFYHQPTDGAPHDNTPRLYVSQLQRLFIHAQDQWSTVNRNTQGHQSFISLSVLSPTHGRSPTRQYPAVVCITAAEIIYPCPRSMEHCEPKYTGTPIIHLPVGFITNPRTEPHTTIPRRCMYHSGRDYLSMPYQHIYYGISKKVRTDVSTRRWIFMYRHRAQPR